MVRLTDSSVQAKEGVVSGLQGGSRGASGQQGRADEHACQLFPQSLLAHCA